MANGTPFAVNFLFLLFLLIPGYAVLRGYLNATVQLDTISRLDKLMITGIGGILTLLFLLVLNRFGVFNFVVDSWYGALTNQPNPSNLTYSLEHAITPSEVTDFSALSLTGVILVQMVSGYVFGYIFGTFVHLKSKRPQKSDKDLQQPWETAIRMSAIGDPVTVVTNEDQEIRGQLYRIGSPSENEDLLLRAAERIRKGGDPEPLGMTYHHHRDILQVRFPELIAEPQSEDGNWIVRRWNTLERRWSDLCTWMRIKRHELRYSSDKFEDAIANARRVCKHVRETREEPEGQ